MAPELAAAPPSRNRDPARPPKLKIRGARKTYGAVLALDDTDLDLAEGEFLTLLGPSGSGKTTLLMTVAGLTMPDRGEVWIDGRDASHLPSFKRDIGMVFQSYALFPHMNVFENVAFPLRMRRLGAAEIARAVGRALDIVRLPGMAERLPRELSGGQQQRVALARCFVYRPSIILMDEPLGALDKKLRDQMQLEIKQLHAELGTSVLYVTHDQDEALVLSDRICLMNEGGIEQIGTADELYFRPRSIFAADFLGDSNIVSARVVGIGEWVALDAAGSRLLASATDEAVAIGQELSIMVRPENLRVLDPGEAAENMVEGTLRDVIMLGGVTRYFVRLAGGAVLSAKRLTTGRRAEGEIGAVIRLGWAARDSVLLTRRTFRRR
ncbi:MAG: ABC transporter ATP-binding protein [Alphaproteobacteria bacterium]|nr:ABC transporter ATP-binding protein [Alphaproteobacteria bacterium]